MMKTNENDTIAAISSGLTESGIGIVRMSGPDSYFIARRIFRKKDGGSVNLTEPNRVHYGYVYDVSRETSDDRILDEALMINLKAPHSYTGEDTIEIDCHGGVLVMQKILGSMMVAGARLADPGEFTKRAFLNGRIDLAQAEAVIDLIQAGSEHAIRASMSQLQGSTSGAIRDLRSRILEDTAYIEAALDDPEHYSLEEWRSTFERHIGEIENDLRDLADSFATGRIIREGIRTVILGRPNAGKSSLMNAMLGEERAIVTRIPGTTRDTIEESVRLNGLTVHLMDTAGIRGTDDPVETIGVERAKASLDCADLVLCIIDASEPLAAEDQMVLKELKTRDVRVLFLFNKSDLPTVLKADEILESMPENKRHYLSVSALTKEGIPELKEKITELFSAGHLRFSEDNVICSLRHAALLTESLSSIQSVQTALADRLPEDFYTVDLMEAYRLLGQIIGEEVDEDLIDEIFGKFCMGK